MTVDKIPAIKMVGKFVHKAKCQLTKKNLSLPQCKKVVTTKNYKMSCNSQNLKIFCTEVALCSVQL